MFDISALGGTGNLGAGIIKRASAAGHDVVVGSRKDEKAKRLAKKYNQDLKEAEVESTKIVGMINRKAAQNSEIVVVTIPYKYAPATVESLDLSDKIVVSPLVPMKKVGKNFRYRPPKEGSAAEELQSKCEGKVVSAFHNVPAGLLSDCGREISCDVVVCGDDEKSKRKVMEFVKDLSNLRPLDGGPLSASSLVESTTPLLLNLAMKNELEETSLFFRG